MGVLLGNAHWSAAALASSRTVSLTVMPQRQRWYGLQDCGTMQCLAFSSFAFSASVKSHYRKADHMRMVSPMSEVCSKLPEAHCHQAQQHSTCDSLASIIYAVNILCCVRASLCPVKYLLLPPGSDLCVSAYTTGGICRLAWSLDSENRRRMRE
jgi:hypothetical protein